MKVCIAEKPSVAKDIARVLGANSRKDGYFEGQGYQVTWTFGHLCTLKEPHDYHPEWKRWQLEALPMIPDSFGIKLISNKGVRKQFKIIEKLVKGAELVINCGDAGQEGEVIQRWVLQKANCKAPVYRLWISSLTQEAIREGFSKLKPANDYDTLYAAGSSRAIGDWLLGMNATRLYTVKYGGFKQVLSIGRVQTPTLAMVVERQKEIDNFKPEPYWELKTKFKEVLFTATAGRFKTAEEGQQLLQQVLGQPFIITSFTRKEGQEAPPRLFDLTSLQVSCNRKFGLSADETLKSIQGLYEKKLTTYPRVDTTYLTTDLHPKIPGILKRLTRYSQFTAPLLGQKIPRKKRIFDDSKVTDHHAIIPTGVEPGSISEREQKVYDEVVRCFLAAFYPNCLVAKTTVMGESAKVPFKANGKVIVDPGWRRVYQEAIKSKEQEAVLPVFKEGESGPHQPELQEKMTQPPRHYTEATLLRAMETAGKKTDDEELRELMKSNGIGRPSTRANIIETLFRRKYIRKVKKALHATETGIQLIDTINQELLKSPELTGQWEKKLRDMEAGTYAPATFMGEMRQMVSILVNQVRDDSGTTIIGGKSQEGSFKGKKSTKGTRYQKSSPPASRDTISSAVQSPAISSTSKEKPSAPSKGLVGSLCPRCGEGKLLKGNLAWGCSRYREGCHFVIPFIYGGKKISEKAALSLVTKKKTPLLKGVHTGGLIQDGSLALDEDGQVVWQPQAKKVLICPRCHAGKIIKGHSAYGCSNFRNGCDVRIPFEILGKKLTERQLEKLILDGATPKIKGFVMPGSGFKRDGYLFFNADWVVEYGENKPG